MLLKGMHQIIARNEFQKRGHIPLRHPLPRFSSMANDFYSSGKGIKTRKLGGEIDLINSQYFI